MTWGAVAPPVFHPPPINIPTSPTYDPLRPTSPTYDPTKPNAYNPDSPQYTVPKSPEYNPDSPMSPEYTVPVNSAPVYSVGYDSDDSDIYDPNKTY